MPDYDIITNANRVASFPREYPPLLGMAACEAAQAVIRRWPGYAPTPLRNLAGMAERARVGELAYKDEASRFGLGSFKALGGPYAIYRLLSATVERRTGTLPGLEDLLNGAWRDLAAGLTIATATDGNHGRAVAWGAKLFGCASVIYLHEHVSKGREEAIRAYGARIVRVRGNYDDSVRQAKKDAAAYGWHIISDTSYEGYTEYPAYIMQGYTLMAREAMDALPHPPTHVFLQGGVGAMAAAVAAYMGQYYGSHHPRFIVVEPQNADCLFQSARAGKPVTVTGALETIMAGLACGEVSLLAWDVLKTSCAHFMTVSDAWAARTMRLLAEGQKGVIGARGGPHPAPLPQAGEGEKDAPVVAGESAVAGLAALLAIRDDEEARRRLAITQQSRVLVFGTEGATDPELYRRIIGMEETSPCAA